jgi:hypothetical protein
MEHPLTPSFRSDSYRMERSPEHSGEKSFKGAITKFKDFSSEGASLEHCGRNDDLFIEISPFRYR